MKPIARCLALIASLVMVLAPAACMRAAQAPPLAPHPTSVAALPTSTPPPTATPVPTPLPTPTALPFAGALREAQALAGRSDFAGAEAAYRRVLAVDDGYGPAHAALSRLYDVQTGRDPEAFREAQRATSLAPDDAAGWIALAHAYLRGYNSAEAVRAAEAATRADPESPDAQAVLASAYLVDGRPTPARAAITRTLELDPHSAAAYGALGELYEAQGDYGRARLALARAEALEPLNVVWPVRSGELLATLQLYDRAAEKFERASLLAPDYLPAVLGKAGLAMRRQTYNQASSLIDRAQALAPAAPRPRIQAARLHVLRGELDQAASAYQEALARAPDDVEARLGLAELHQAQGDCEAAAGQFQVLTAQHPRLAAALLGQASAAACLGNAERALALAQQAAELGPCDANAYAQEGALLAGRQHWADAERAYVSAWQCSPVGADVQAGLGQMYLAQGELQAAADAFALARRLNPLQAGVADGLCQTYLRDRDDSPALRECAEAARLEPNGTASGQRHALALLRSGRDADARDVLRQVLDRAPMDAQSHHYLGVAYLNLGDYPAARREFVSYQDISKDPDERLGALLEALDRGWAKPDDGRFISDLRQGVQQQSQSPAKVFINATESPTRTLVLGFVAAPGADPDQTGRTTLAVLRLGSLAAARLEPPLRGEVAAVAFDSGNKPLFALVAGAQQARDLATLMTSADDFTRQVWVADGADFENMHALTDADVAAIAGQVAELRELKPSGSIKFAQMDRQAYASRKLERAMTQFSAAANRQALDRLLGLIEPSTDLAGMERDLAVQRTAGVYEPTDKTFYLIQGKEPSLEDRVTVAHEYVHVLQDQNFAMDSKMSLAADDDRAMALRALVEGDAELATTIYAEQQVPVQDRSLRAAIGEHTNLQTLDTAPLFLRGSFSFPYTEGMQFVEQMRGNSGWQAVDRLYTRPPVSTAQILHPDLYRLDHRPVTVHVPYLVGQLGGGWLEADYGVMGELGWRLALAQHIGQAPAAAAAAGWGGDRFALLRQASGNGHAAVFIFKSDDVREAEEFAHLVGTSLDRRTGYGQETPDLLAARPTRHWSYEDTHWVLWQGGQTAGLVAAPTEELASKLLGIALPEARAAGR